MKKKKKKYRIRKGSIAWYVIKLRYVILICLLLVIAVLLGREIIAMESTDTSHKGNDIIVTEDNSVTETKMQYYDVPLNKDLQAHIITLCKDYGVEPKIIIAMIQRESNYKSNAIGDSGDSLGLMQVQPKWHKKRMNKLGVTDLLDPYQNVKVGIDIFAEKANKYSTTEEALTVYNSGDNGAYNLYFSKGIKANQYALDIIKIANNLTLL